MNKNLLALSAAAASAMAFSASAAVSSNIVGYVKLDLATGYNLVNNPLNNTNTDGNKISKLYGSIDCVVNRWNGSGFTTTEIIATPDGPVLEGDDMTVAPGEAIFLFVSAPKSVTYVGEALVNTQTIPIAIANNFVASKIPLSGDLTTLGLVAPDGTSVSTWTGLGYKTYEYFGGLGWVNNDVVGEPTIAVGQGLVINALAPFTWTKTFTPAP